VGHREVEVYLFGANVTSWKLPNQSEVLYMRPDRQQSYNEPIRCARYYEWFAKFVNN
jgi:D-hexose-6-phosphate mutarotase